MTRNAADLTANTHEAAALSNQRAVLVRGWPETFRPRLCAVQVLAIGLLPLASSAGAGRESHWQLRVEGAAPRPGVAQSTGAAAVTVILRPASRDDLPDLFRVRHAVAENHSSSLGVPDEPVIEALESTGRGWVIELDGVIVAFAVADAFTGGIGALFVDPRYRGQGYGRRLHDTVVEWLWAQERIAWLNAQPGSEA